MTMRFLVSTLLFVASSGCSSSGGTGGAGGAGGEGGAGGGEEPPVVTVLTPSAAPLPGQTECTVTITDGLPNAGQKHHPICTPLTYATNPPSSWGSWAKYQSYVTPVPREMYVHNLEHGGIVMAYDCDGACPEVVAALEQTATDFGVDETCLAIENGAERSRIVITPDTLLDAPIGLAAWRATYVATCIDPKSLLAFVRDHYRRGPEDLCNDGKDPNDPATGVLACGL